MGVQSFHDLTVWQKSIELVEAVYRATSNFPREEVYGLTAQIRRAAVSIPANIAEGQSRNSTPEFLRFLSIAMGSRSEVETHVIVARRLQFLDTTASDDLLNQLGEIGRMLRGLCRSLTPPSEH
jgi:four helix bundle protein